MNTPKVISEFKKEKKEIDKKIHQLILSKQRIDRAIAAIAVYLGEGELKERRRIKSKPKKKIRVKPKSKEKTSASPKLKERTRAKSNQKIKRRKAVKRTNYKT